MTAAGAVAVCVLLGHDLRHTEHPLSPERVFCVRDGCDLDVSKHRDQPCLRNAYTCWSGVGLR